MFTNESSSQISSQESPQVWLETDSDLLWKDLRGSRVSWDTSPGLNGSEPVYLFRRDFTRNDKRISSSFRIESINSTLSSLLIACYHSEVEPHILSSPTFDSLQNKSPKWMNFHHGRMGGILLKQWVDL